MKEIVNLAVDLPDAQFGEQARARAFASIERAGYAVEMVRGGGDAFLAWLDDAFGGTWSSEAYAGSSIIARKDGAFGGFATYDPDGLTFSWLRGAAREPGTGIFGPFGVAAADRKSGIGPALLIAALASLRALGYQRAIIPAVGEEKLVAYYAQQAGARIVETFEKAAFRRRRFRTVVLASGNGSNFQSVIDGADARRLPLDLVLLASNKPRAFALERARRNNIAAVALPWDRSLQTRASYDEALLDLVRRDNPELVLLLGWMHLLSEAFVREFPATINIHPAFLPLNQRLEQVGFPDGSFAPAFRGADAVADAVALKCAWVGATSHLISLDADRGPVLTRKPLAVRQNEPAEQIMERLHPLEHAVVASGIMRWVFEG
ncbi:MAG: formyltransferase family protein [Candidatus Baltobacteraceae bacterium]